MKFEIKSTKNKTESLYKSLYISEALAKQIQQIATDNNTSFNNVVISMIKHCLNEDEE